MLLTKNASMSVHIRFRNTYKEWVCFLSMLNYVFILMGLSIVSFVLNIGAFLLGRQSVLLRFLFAFASYSSHARAHRWRTLLRCSSWTSCVIWTHRRCWGTLLHIGMLTYCSTSGIWNGASTSEVYSLRQVLLKRSKSFLQSHLNNFRHQLSFQGYTQAPLKDMYTKNQGSALDLDHQ